MDELQVVRYLNESEVFSGLSPEDLEPLHGQCRETLFDDGAVIVEQGAPAESVYVLVEGSVSRLEPPEGTSTELGHIEQGSLVGLTALSGFDTWRATLRAEGTVRAIKIPLASLKQMLHDNPAASYVVMKRVAAKIPMRV